MGIFNRTPDEQQSSVTQPQRFNAPRGLTAAAQVLSLSDKTEVERVKERRAGDPWQDEAWGYYDSIGEIKYAAGLIGAVCSRIRLYAAAVTSDDTIPSPLDEVDNLPDGLEESARRVMRRLETANGGIPGLLHDAAINLFVAGECYLVQIPERLGTGTPEQWKIKSIDEFVPLSTSSRAGSPMWGIKPRANAKRAEYIELPPHAASCRIWRMHPRYSDEADSNLRSMLDLCDELLLLSRAARSTERSRLNAGMLYVPDGLSVSAAADGEVDPTDPNAEAEFDDTDEFEDELVESMSTPITDESSAAAVVPLIVRGPAELADKIKLIKFERAFDPQLTQRGDRVLERILAGLDIPKDVVTGLANIKYCVSDDTEALTRTGWKRYTDLQVGDEVLTLNPITGHSEWQSVSDVSSFNVVDEPMFSIDKRGHSSLSTMNHRWLVQNDDGTYREVTSETSRPSDRIPLAAPASDLPIETKYSDDLVELVAWFYTEGSLGEQVKNTGRFARAGEFRRRWASIAQSETANPEHFYRIRALLTRLFGPESQTMDRSIAASAGWRNSSHGGSPAWRVCASSADNSGYQFLLNEEAINTFEFALADADKAVSREFIYSMTRAQLELFVQVSSWADGCGADISGSVFGQKVESRQESFELACHLLGLPIARRADGDGWYDCTVKKRSTANMTGEVQNYTGTVWCPTTENGTWFARRNGTYYFTGNTNAVQIEESLYKSHIEPLILLICDALTVGFLRPVLKSLGYTDEQLQRIVVWYDPSAITTKPDRASAATKLYELKELSGDALRRANGFSDADKPDPIETAQRLAIERGALSEPITEALLKLLVPQLMEQVRQQQIAQSPAPMGENVQQVLDPNAPVVDPAAPEVEQVGPPPEQGTQPQAAPPPTGLIEP